MKRAILIILSALFLSSCFFGCVNNTDAGISDVQNLIPMPKPGSSAEEKGKNEKNDAVDDVTEKVADSKEKSDDDSKSNSENTNIEIPKVEIPNVETPAAEGPQASDEEETKIPTAEEPQTPVTEEPQTPVAEEPQTPAVEEPQTPSAANQQDGLTTIQRQKPINKPETYTGDKYLLLVNPWNYLPADFERNTRKIEGHYIDVGAYDDIVNMLADMRKEGLSPYICSSTRTIEYQENLFNKRLKKNKAAGLSEQDALDETAKWTAIPGTSEHHTGYALDIVSAKNTTLDKSQENTPEQQWMMKNSWKYGFILRYPEGKTHITGIYYEPWHYRYVGKEAAKEIYESGLTFEEYLQNRN